MTVGRKLVQSAVRMIPVGLPDSHRDNEPVVATQAVFRKKFCKVCDNVRSKLEEKTTDI